MLKLTPSIPTALAVLVAAGHLATAKGESIPHPILRAPKLAEAPVIDGKIQAEEWGGAAAVTGVASHMAAGFTASVVPEIQQVVWYIGYDDAHLYLAMHSPHMVGTLPKARVKRNDAGNPILWDDHVEIQLCKHGRTEAATPGKGFYKVMVNPRGYYTDQWFHNGTPGTEDEWATGGVIRCSVAEDHWDLEMALPLGNFGVKSLDGETWVIQLVRTDSCAGVYFAGWTPASWMEWHKFAAVTFDPEAPAFQFRSLGRIRKGRLDARIGLVGAAGKPTTVDVDVSVLTGEKRLYGKSQRAAVAKGERKELAWTAEDLPIAEEGNTVRIAATIPGAEPDAPPTVLYRVTIPVLALTDAYYKQYIEPWIKGRPSSGDWEFQFAYSPYGSCIEATVDVDFLGMPEELLKASRYDLTLTAEGGKTLFKASVPLEGMVGYTTSAVPELPAGEYAATAVLYAADGKTELGRKSCEFVRKKFAWEHNKIGTSDRVIPPYAPLETEGAHIRPWGRDYTIGESGLPADILVSRQPNGRSPNQRLLAAPIRLVARMDGKDETVANASMKITSAKDHRVELEAAGDLGGVRVTTNAFMEYDGWYQVKLDLAPAKPVRCEALDLVCDLWPGADTIYAQRRDGRNGSKFGAAPAGDGVVWHSGELPVYHEGWGSFVPIVFLGSGDMGLWWIAETDAGWVRDDKTFCVQVERYEKRMTLRFRMMGRPTVLKGPRTIEFALLVSPVKPKPSNWRAFAWGWPEPHYAHDTCGYRYWGDSVDAYALASDEEYRKLRQFILNPTQVNPEYSWYERLAKQVRAGKPIALYGSTRMTGMGMEEFDTFAGEWLGTNNVKPQPDNSFKGRPNYQNTVTWTTPRQLTATTMNFVQSQVDCFIWYHKKLVQLAEVNGTWWDNSSIGLAYDLVPGKGRVYRWNVFLRRQLTKRLATMCWELGRPPLWIQNMHADFSWCQVGWHIENDFYPAGIGQDLLGMLTVDEFRSMCAIKGGIIPQLHSVVPGGTENPFDAQRVIRAGLGLCLLHDIGERGYPPWRPFVARQRGRLLGAMEKHVGFFTAHPNNFTLIPYWRQHTIKTATPGIYASVYCNRETCKAAAVILNANDSDVVLRDFTVDGRETGIRSITRILDAETELPIGKEYDRKKRQYVWGEFRPYHLMIKRHDYRLLVIE